jgi:hypothetical protein
MVTTFNWSVLYIESINFVRGDDELIVVDANIFLLVPCLEFELTFINAFATRRSSSWENEEERFSASTVFLFHVGFFFLGRDNFCEVPFFSVLL